MPNSRHARPLEGFARRSARILLIDEHQRVFLFKHYWKNSPNPLCWMTPGGGINEGEQVLDAAVRELREETGISVSPVELRTPVAYTSGYADLSWRSGIFRDDYFVHRVSGVDIDTSGFEDHERSTTIGYRWWSAEEIDSSDETIIPLDLASLLNTLNTGVHPDEPIQLPWHH